MKNKNLIKLFRVATIPRSIIFKTMIFGTILCILLVIESYFFGIVIDAAGRPLEEILKPVIIIVLITISEYICTVFRPKYQQIFIETGLYHIRSQILKVISHLDVDTKDDHSSGDLMSRTMGDLNAVASFVRDQLFPFYDSILFLIMGFFVCFYVSIPLTIIAFIFILIELFMGLKISKIIEKNTLEARKTIGHANGVLRNIVTSITAIKSFALYDSMNQKFKDSMNDYVKAETKVAKVTALLQPIFMSFWYIPFLVTGAMASIFVFNGYMTPGEFITFNFTFNFVNNGIMGLKDFIQGLGGANASAIRVIELLEMKIEDKHPVEEVKTQDIVVDLSHIYFSYQQDKLVLNDVSLQIKKGEVVAIVGASGSGKSTLVRILCGLRGHYQGKAMINHIDIAPENYATIRNQLSIVSQENFLFPDTIFFNVSLGEKEVTKTQVIEACVKAGIHEFIETLPNGYDSIIGEKGCNLSGGQRQRLCIARAFLHDRDILILDEPTSSLDIISENYIQQTLSKLMKNKTVITIAHRLSTIKDANRIIVMKEGQIKEMGSHQELLKMQGEYYHLYHSHEMEENHETV